MARFETTLEQICNHLGGICHGDSRQPIDAIEPIETAHKKAISFVANPKYGAQIDVTQAGCLIVSPALQDRALARGACIVTAEPYLYFARLTQWWRAQTLSLSPSKVEPLIHPNAYIHPTATIGDGARVGAFSVVAADAVIGAGAVIKNHVSVDIGASIGADSVLHPQVTVGEHCVVGARCIVHAGVVVGADGFGFAPNQGRWEKIEQLGRVRVGDDVEIGANTCLDRGALGDTVISDGVKLDNLIQIGHNVFIGAHTAMAGCVGVAGSAKIGAHCTVGGGAIVLGHLSVADHVHISAATVVTRSITKPGHYTGIFPIDDNGNWEKNAAVVKQLGGVRERLRALEQRITVSAVDSSKLK